MDEQPALEPVQPAQKGHRHYFAFFIAACLVLFAVTEVGNEIKTQLDAGRSIPVAAESALASVAEPDIVPQSFLHQLAPEHIEGIYLTGWTAGTQKRLARTYSILDDTTINTVVIDIKDATGKISYQPKDADLAATGVGTKRIANLSELIQNLHERGVYVIGRVAVFQDPFYAAAHPEDTFTDTRTGGVWRDYKGIAWLRPDSVAVWRYIVQISRDAYAQGFDEINVDYVRYPSDGELKFISSSQTVGKIDTIERFFAYLDTELRGSGIPLSADVFGLTLSLNDGLGIGQKIEAITPHVDYICPMIYPSHYYNGTFGIAVPAAKPYEIIHRALSDGMAKLQAVNEPVTKLRPWLQDFDLVGVSYTKDMVQAQIRASRELGINSWLMWDPKNTYTKDAFDLEESSSVE